MHWQFTVGQLTNFGPAPLLSLVTMLNMMLPDEQVTDNDALTYFKSKVNAEELIFVGGCYQLP